MFPSQPKQWPQVLVGIVVVVWVFNNPTQAADFVNQAVAAINAFANRLGQ